MMQKIIIWTLFFALLGAVLVVSDSCALAENQKYMTEDEYQMALAAQSKIHGFIRIATQCEKKGQYALALENYSKAYAIDQCGGLVAVCRGAMADNYEALGEYEKALGHIEWFLTKLKPDEPLFQKMTATKQRLLQKIEARKGGGKGEWKEFVVAAQPDQQAPSVSDFVNADYGTQRQFMQRMPDSTEISRLAKQALLDEHAGKFREARESYEKMLARKDETVAAFEESGWAMLHAAVQRTSEVTGDEAREKEMLVWIRDNMFSDQGSYHQYLSGLLPPVQDHLKERLALYDLEKGGIEHSGG